VRRPGGATFDLHQGSFDIDEAALDIGVRYTVALAERAAQIAVAAQAP
jgi:amidohydrolase